MAFKKTLAIALVLLFLGLSLRLLFLDLRSIGGDETYSYGLSKISHAEFILKNIDFVWPPAFYIVLHYWMTVSENEIWMRLLPVLFGVLSLLALYFYSKKVFGEKTALIALALGCFSYTHIEFSQHLRGYSFVLFFATVSFFSFYLASANRDKRQMCVFFLASAVGALFSYFQFFALFAILLYCLVAGKGKKYLKLSLAALLASLLIDIVFIVPSILYLNSPGAAPFCDLNKLGLLDFIVFSIQTTAIFFSSGYGLLRLAFVAIFVSAIAFFLFFKNMKTEAEKFVAFCFIAYFAVLVLLAFFFQHVAARYFLAVFPLFCVILAKGISGIRSNAIAGFLLLLFFSANIVQLYYNVDAKAHDQTTLKAAAACINAGKMPGDSVIVFSVISKAGMEYYLNGDNPVYLSFELQDVKVLLANRPAWIFYSDGGHFLDANNEAESYFEENGEIACPSVYYFGKNS